ncbi:MAG: hypothetical protein JWQ38_2829 [Flavipsychrobacter sp.]|nr:hypothetical protein [Flavipsychrobacter sp.]
MTKAIATLFTKQAGFLKYTIVLFMLYIPITDVIAQEDYRVYHALVNNAERYFFNEGKVDSALLYYDDAFAKFDFAFASDCFMATQIAVFKNDKRSRNYIIKSYKNGITPHCWNYSPVLKSLINDSAKYNKQVALCKQYRKTYLDRIHKKTLLQVIKHVSEDQCEKNELPPIPYAKKLNAHIDFILNAARGDNFPGEKNIGIDQPNILSELGFENQDYKDNFTKYKDRNVTQDQFKVCEECIAQQMVFPLLVHHPCTYNLLNIYWSKLIITGQVHPREVAMLFDNILRFNNSNPLYKHYDKFYCSYDDIPSTYYKNNLFVNYKEVSLSNKAIDSFRRLLFINPLRIDSAKEVYKSKYHFMVNFGFWSCR